jgi:hypothetical protein
VSNFEERLLVELRSVVAAEPVDRGRRGLSRRRLALAGGLAAVLAAAAIGSVFFLSTGTPAAYAVTTNADGSVTVEIDSLTDAAGLQAKLQAAGVSAVVEYLPLGKMCKQPWFTPAGPAADGETQQSSVGGARGGNGPTTFTISRDRPAGTTLVVTTQTGPGNEQALGIGWAKGDVPPCQVVDAPPGSGPLGGPPAGGQSSP